MYHHSYHSCSSMNDLLVRVFPDSDIACKLQLGATKVAYITHFGFTEHFMQKC